MAGENDMAVPEKQHACQEPLVVLRLLNGPMRGGEFSLGAGVTLFVATPAAALAGAAVQSDFPDNALYIPVEQDAANFEVEVLADPEQPLAVMVRETGAGTDAVPAIWCTAQSVGGLAFAIRPAADHWPEHILRYTGAEAAAVEPAMPGDEAEWPAAATSLPWYRCLPEYASTTIGVVATVVLILGAAWWWQRETPLPDDAAMLAPPSQQQVHLAQLLAGATGQYRILPGRDGLMYVFAGNVRDAGWARQALTRGGRDRDSRVLQTSVETARVSALLGRTEGPLAYHVLRLDDPSRPVLLLSSDRAPLDPAASHALERRITSLLPYAAAATVQTVADSTVARQAEAGLLRLGVHYDKTRHDDSVTLTMQSIAGDGQLQKIRAFAEQFYRQWGTRYVYFAVEMADDLRKGKSFGYGGSDYLKTAPSHWDFSV